MAAALDGGFEYALAKGRARYVCRLKLEHLAAGSSNGVTDLIDDDPDAITIPGSQPYSASSVSNHSTTDADLLARWRDAIGSGAWDGDKDQLDEVPHDRLWSSVAAERYGCTGRHCPLFRSCAYFQARARLAQAQVIVANHDLVLASIGQIGRAHV